MSQHYSDPRRVDDPHALPDVEIFWNEGAESTWGDRDDILSSPGWYWWACSPGCLPDSDPRGPFSTAAEALADAQEGSDDFDDSDTD